MRVRRVFVDAPLTSGASIGLRGSAANHLRRVLRLGAGDTVTLFNGAGSEFAGRIDAARDAQVTVQVGEERAIRCESPLGLTLAQGVARGERMDLVVQKATELGVTRLVPLLTERSVVRLDPRQAARKLAHWRAIAIAACEQSGRNILPQVDAPVALPEFLATAPTGGAQACLLLSPTATARIAGLPATLRAVCVLIGPEGGLSADEQAAAARAGFTPLRLGPRVLRTETAALAALAALQQHCGDL